MGRPKIKVKEYECWQSHCESSACWMGIKPCKKQHLKKYFWTENEKRIFWLDGGYTGETREIEREMTSSEYIEYLENKQTKFLEIVAGVFEKHGAYEYGQCQGCSIDYETINDYHNHLLQQIKKELEKHEN